MEIATHLSGARNDPKREGPDKSGNYKNLKDERPDLICPDKILKIEREIKPSNLKARLFRNVVPGFLPAKAWQAG
jgi:hypothetical protein